MSDALDHEAPITSRIGKVAAAWAIFEYRTNEIIWHLANLDIEVGACITAQIQSPSNRLRALIALVTVREGSRDLIKELNRFSVLADNLARQRNRFVHDPWIQVTGKDPFRVEVTADKKLRFQTISTTLEDMDKLATEIAAAIAALGALYARIKSELPPWPDTSHSQSLGKDPTRVHTHPDIDPSMP